MRKFKRGYVSFQVARLAVRGWHNALALRHHRAQRQFVTAFRAFFAAIRSTRRPIRVAFEFLSPERRGLWRRQYLRQIFERFERPVRKAAVPVDYKPQR